MSRYRPVDPAQSFPDLEQQVLERWRDRDVFRESIRRREGAEQYRFYDGPATANGPPGSHHVLARVFKDVFPRFKTMRGYQVYRKGGWDCHGLPVELAVEQELGFSSKADIERYGVAEFNARCRESVLRYIDEWNRLTERIGHWIDTDDAYVTLDNDYIESVWWSLKQVFDQGLLTEGFRVAPYCTRDGTALSSHEVAVGYRDVIDPSVYVRFPLLDDPSVSLLAWTTMPWTLVPHAAIAVDPAVTYVRARLGEDRLILAEPLVERVLGEEAEIEERMPGSALLGLRYEPPFPYIGDYGERGHTVLAGDFVSTEDGTGVVHTGAAFGEDDFRLATENGLTIHNPVKPDGTFDERTGPFAGMYVRDADAPIVDALRESGRLFRAGEYEHSYPALLALRHAAHLLRQAQLVRAHHRAPGGAAGRQRGGHLVPGPHQARPLRQVAREQRGLGALASSATGARRCRSGVRTTARWSAWARGPSCASSAPRSPTTSTGPTSTT